MKPSDRRPSRRPAAALRARATPGLARPPRRPAAALRARAKPGLARPSRRPAAALRARATPGLAIYFASPGELRRWFDKNHERAGELWVGYYKRATGKPSVTWQEAVEEALAVGWIDGVRHSVDDERFKQRFTPRRPGSNWSNINIATAKRLIASGRMRPAGKRAFEAHTKDGSGTYSFERNVHALPPAMAKQFRANRAAWAYFSTQAPYYQRLTIHWVTSAKQEETRQRRLGTLIADSAAGQRIKALRRPEKK